ncbi:hypothetical protein Gotur_013531 [Gossypium turneri]
MPNLTFGGTAKEYGTVNSATLIAESNYFVAANLNIVNSAPKPESGKTVGGQAVALRVSGDRSAIYNCNIYGFQDTSNPRVVYAYTDMSNVVNPAGWTHNRFPERAKIQVQGARCKSQ